jgi:hypothetical protein
MLRNATRFVVREAATTSRATTIDIGSVGASNGGKIYAVALSSGGTSAIAFSHVLSAIALRWRVFAPQ